MQQEQEPKTAEDAELERIFLELEQEPETDKEAAATLTEEFDEYIEELERFVLEITRTLWGSPEPVPVVVPRRSARIQGIPASGECIR